MVVQAIARNHDPELILKRVTNCSNIYEVEHWKTLDILKCKGKWERNVVNYLNTNKVDFDWQVPFNLSDGRTYIIDFYDRSRDHYVEIKGWWQDDAKVKYELLKQDYPSINVEVWSLEELKGRNIPIR